MNYSIREMRKEEYSLLGDFLYEAIYIMDGKEVGEVNYLRRN